MGSGKSEPPPPEKKPVESPSAKPDLSVTSERGLPRSDVNISGQQSLLAMDEENERPIGRNLIG